MCGIGGVLGGRSHVTVEALLSALRHRGPDGEAAWERAGCSLVHTRLAILDPTPTGAQPMLLVREKGGVVRAVPSEIATSSSDVVAALTFNGEIYNRDELKQELLAAGVDFLGNSDTEVLLHHLYRSGRSILPRLAGMFAFCLWLVDEKRALLAVDRFGIKPLYIAESPNGSVAFASEVRAIRKPRNASNLDPESVRDFLMWGSVPAPSAIQRGVRQLPAGHAAEWSKGRLDVSSWHVPPRVTDSGDPSQLPVRKTDGLRDYLEESVQRHLLSDVPVAVFLSGGIDSTAILATARRLLGQGQEIHTFSLGSDSLELDETAIARRTARHFNAIHHEKVLEKEEARSEFERYMHAMDLPTIDGFNTWCISRFVSDAGFKVALSGVGGDEFFAGYSSFRQFPRLRRLYRAAGVMRVPLGSALIASNPGGRWARLGAALQRRATPLSLYHAIRGIFTEAEAGRLTSRLTGHVPDSFDWIGVDPCSQDPAQQVSDLEVSRYMASQLLRDADVFSMRNGLELRTPLVDSRFAERVRTIPTSNRLRFGKAALVEAVPEIPSWVLEHPKMGFRLPFDEWVDELIEDGDIAFVEGSSCRLDHWYRKWACAALGRWARD
ncbi:asparagine synthase (glutamine-hydrolyzing) [bacterium]|nr:asparagine synthase (glutamine-hydrolyzing) [bacterium]